MANKLFFSTSHITSCIVYGYWGRPTHGWRCVEYWRIKCGSNSGHLHIQISNSGTEKKMWIMSIFMVKNIIPLWNVTYCGFLVRISEDKNVTDYRTTFHISLIYLRKNTKIKLFMGGTFQDHLYGAPVLLLILG